MKFDVLSDAWIPVRCLDGEIKRAGIIEVITRAEQLKEITHASPIVEFGIYRLLFAFLMDAFQPEDTDDIEDLYEKGAFDPDIVQKYVQHCMDVGISFDLFDKNTPFLQARPDQWTDDSNKKSVAYLNPAIPTGNNHIHFDHRLQDSVEMEPWEVAQLLPSVGVFCTAGVQGYPSGVNGAPPLFTIVRGRTLFETLLFGMVPKSQYDNYADPGPLWRSSIEITPKDKVAMTSLLFGLTFPARKITICPGEKVVSSMFYCQGLNFSGYDTWRDPYVVYLETKNGRVSLKPSIDKENWRNLAAIYDQRNSASDVVKQYVKVFSPKTVEVTLYGVVTNQASYLDFQRGEYHLSNEIVSSGQRMDLLLEALKTVEKAKSSLSEKINSFEEKMNRNKNPGILESEKKRCILSYYYSCKELFFNRLCLRLEEEDIDLPELQKNWERAIYSVLAEEYENYIDRLNLNGAGLLRAHIGYKKGKEG